jgi:hypothetical protein
MIRRRSIGCISTGNVLALGFAILFRSVGLVWYSTFDSETSRERVCKAENIQSRRTISNLLSVGAMGRSIFGAGH